jgi:hypothetical protein
MSTCIHELGRTSQSGTFQPAIQHSLASKSAMSDMDERAVWVAAIRWAMPLFECLQDYELNWDGEGAAIPTGNTSIFALSLLTFLRVYHRATEPDIAPIRDGGISLEWQHGDRCFEIEAGPGEKAQFLYRSPDAESRRFGPVLTDEGLTPNFMLAARMMFS